jgi:two-component system CheB/CheR fusion protein
MNDAVDSGFEALLQFLQQSRGFDFSGYKRPSLMRRVMRRMEMLGVEGFSAYRDYLELHQDEFALLFNAILINVTSFFRDPPAWEFVAREVIPNIARGGPDGQVRVWSAGCASGEEAYTVAILLAEHLGTAEFRDRVKIYATDVDEEALSQARQAAYFAKDLEPIEPALRERYFEQVGGKYLFRADLRRAVIFGRNDLVQDAPISRLDLLICRNTLMYFNAETQTHILNRFSFALGGPRGGQGYLFLGRAEMLLTHASLFSPLDMKCRVFLRIPQRPRSPALQEVQNGIDVMPRQIRLHEQALEESPVARIVVDADGLLTIANQRARVLFSISANDVGRPMKDLEISYRPAELRVLIEQAHAERRAITQTSVERRFSDRDAQFFDIMVQPLYDERQVAVGTAVTFLEVTRYFQLQDALRKVQEEVQTANEELQSSNEELETTNEELQSSNEELETTNEELQSTNEELETMNEELQSTNEELQAVNEELRQRTDELHHMNHFLESVLGSLKSGAIVVSGNLDVLMWNRKSEDLWGLRGEEVRGKSLLNLDIGLPVAELRNVIRQSQGSEGVPAETEVDAVNRRGKRIRCRIACSPLMTGSGGQDGVILIMEEIAQA